MIVEKEISGRVLGRELQTPTGVAVSKRGTLYAVDAGNNRIIRFAEEFNAAVEIGGFGRQAGLLDRPTYLSIDNDLNLWVSDVGNRRIVRFDAELRFVDEIRLTDEEDQLKFGESRGVIGTRFGEVWIADYTNSRLAIFDHVGQFDRFAGEYGSDAGPLLRPEKMILTPEDTFVVCDAGNRRLVLFDEYGNSAGEMYPRIFDYPCSVDIDERRQLWVVDRDKSRITCLRMNGEVLLTVGPVIPGAARPLSSPEDIAVAADGRLIIADTGNNRLLVCRVAYESR
ncbi:MAG: NHL repeat-containing protein [candidate division Zixibacteria bacterium]|nr:NHL repeat-containing protein [candidate division Zixibacteria bacterium]